MLVVGVDDPGKGPDRPDLRATQPEVPVLAGGQLRVDGQARIEQLPSDHTERDPDEVEPDELSGAVVTRSPEQGGASVGIVDDPMPPGEDAHLLVVGERGEDGRRGAGEPGVVVVAEAEQVPA